MRGEPPVGPDEGHQQAAPGDSAVELAQGAAPVLVVRVLPDVVRLDKEFHYAVPDTWHADGRAGRLAVGSIVRITLGGRPMRGWITEVGVEPPSDVEAPAAGQAHRHGSTRRCREPD